MAVKGFEAVSTNVFNDFPIVDVFSKLVFTLFGVYIWELAMTSDFEWSLIFGRRRFRWPLVSICFQFIFFAEGLAEYSMTVFFGN